MKSLNKNSQILNSLTEDYNDIDLEDLETPKYLQSLESSNPLQQKQLTQFVEEVWVPQPELVEKSLAQLEQQDKLYRSQLSQISEKEKQKSSQLLLQRQIYKEVIELGIKINQLSNFAILPDFKVKIKKLLKSLLKVQKQISVSDGRLKNIEENCEKVWNWMAETARDWSSRVDLRIGADIIDQVLRESEKKTDFDIQVYLLRELKTENVTVNHSTHKKPKHKFSKHRKLKFDVHEKLQNFMTPEYAQLDSKHENLLKTLFGKKVMNEEKIYLDIPLV